MRSVQYSSLSATREPLSMFRTCCFQHITLNILIYLSNYISIFASCINSFTLNYKFLIILTHLNHVPSFRLYSFNGTLKLVEQFFTSFFILCLFLIHGVISNTRDHVKLRTRKPHAL